MDAPLIVVFPRGQLSAKDKERLTKHGIISVEADNPRDVCQLHLQAPMVSTAINGDAIVRAALKAMDSQPSENSIGAITEAGRVKSAFVQLLAESTDAARGEK